MEMTTSVSSLLKDYDWKEAFSVANRDKVESIDGAPTHAFDLDDVAKVISIDDGQNDERDWVGVFELKDGRFVFVAAGCDYSGWG